MEKVGLVLEGGGVRGSFTAGALAWLLDHNITFDYSVGISSGALYLTCFEAGRRDALEEMACTYAAKPDNVGLHALLTEGHYVASKHLIREDLSLIASHTCLDQAPGGINDALAECCALLDVEGEGFVRVGTLPKPMRAGELKEYLSAALDTEVRLMGDPEITVSRLGMCSGAGGSEWEAAAALGAEAFLSGEVKHHQALAMADAGVPCFECGHFATERPGIFALADALQSALNQVQYNLDIYKSETAAYASVSGPGQAV